MHHLLTARRRVLLPQRRLLTERASAHLALCLYRPRLCLSWYLPSKEKLVITTGINSTCGLRPSHYTLLRMETGLTTTIFMAKGALGAAGVRRVWAGVRLQRAAYMGGGILRGFPHRMLKAE